MTTQRSDSGEPDEHVVHTQAAVIPGSGDNSVDGVDNPTASAEDTTDTGAADPDPASNLRGSDLARAALEAAKQRSQARGRSTRRVRKTTIGGQRRRGWSGARPDDRDPQPLGRLASRLVTDRGWSDRLAGGHVFSRWATLVGSDVAEHTTPTSLDDGVLMVRADSTAWATQLRLLQRQLLKRIADGVGHGVVRQIKVQGPAAPSWRHGPRHVPGRGPRDTYG